MMEQWNVLATSFEGYRELLLRVLKKHGRFGGAGYRNVSVGRVDDVPAFLQALREAMAAEPRLGAVIAKAVPIERVVRFDPADLSTGLTEAARPLFERLAGGTFHVRLERRGLKGILHAADVERAVGGAAWTALAAAGHTPKVSFADPDRVLLIETLGERAGLAVIDRTMRQTYDFVRVR
jgi:tRNA(Ser,Leu) C12 N-acetylase TAN1